MRRDAAINGDLDFDSAAVRRRRQRLVTACRHELERREARERSGTVGRRLRRLDEGGLRRPPSWIRLPVRRIRARIQQHSSGSSLIRPKNSNFHFFSSNGRARSGRCAYLEADTGGGVMLASGGCLLGWPQPPHRRGQAPDGGGERVSARPLRADIALAARRGPTEMRGLGTAAAGSASAGA